MSYTVELSDRAKKDFASLPLSVWKRIQSAIDHLTDNPRPRGCKKLEVTGFYRIRVGDYRVIYDIYDNVLTVLIIRIGDRQDIYR